MSNTNEINGPRIGLYYGVVIDQDHLDHKLEPIDIVGIVEKITNISPFHPTAVWKLDYDRSQSYRTLVIYNINYSKINLCPGYIGGWITCENAKPISDDVSKIANEISDEIENYLYPDIINDSYVTIGIGYCIVYFVG